MQRGRSIFYSPFLMAIQTPRLLIVDDDEDFRLSLRDFFENADFHCKEAENGIVALQLLMHQSFDIVLTDHQMPRLTGLGMKEVAAKYPLFHNLPFILLTGDLTEALQQRATNAGFAAVILKPFDMAHLVAEVRRIISDKVSENPT